MIYIIKIEQVILPTLDEKYERYENIYQQRVEAVDITAVIKTVNKIKSL